MTSGIRGTGPYSKLDDLRWWKKHCIYQLEYMIDPKKTPRKYRAVQKQLTYFEEQIKKLNAEIKANKTKK